MDKTLVSAVAGSGKTQMIIDSLDLNNRTVIITYTDTNQLSLLEKVREKFGYIPENIHVFGYWEFLYGFCAIPLLQMNFRGIIFDTDIQNALLKKNHYKPIYHYNGYFLQKTFAKTVIKCGIDYLTCCAR